MFSKKHRRTLLFLMVLLLAAAARADLVKLSDAYELSDTQDSMAWPMLPNESVKDLAAKFYPNNQFMQRQFVAKTKRLNKTNISSNARYSKLTAITIPNLKKLSTSVGQVKPSRNKAMHLSYNIKSASEKAKETVRNIPEHLLQQYENLIARNTFLKEEIAKLNKRLVFLQNKLGELKLVLDRTLTFPSKKAIKNLDVEKALAEKPKMVTVRINHEEKRLLETVKTKQQSQTAFFDLSNKLLWLSLFVLGLLVPIGSYLFNKYQQKQYIKRTNNVGHRETVIPSTVVTPIPREKEATSPLSSTSLGNDTVVEEHNDQNVLQEAKALMRKNLPDEAIAHLKWAIRAKSRTSIKFWISILEIFKHEGLQDEFESYASEMHQTFNVMTPLWEEKNVAMVVSQSLEEHPHILDLVTQWWPSEEATNYLHKLISDNRSGQRTGFSLAVVEEILLLIAVLEIRAVDTG